MEAQSSVLLIVDRVIWKTVILSIYYKFTKNIPLLAIFFLYFKVETLDFKRQMLCIACQQQ